MAKSQLPNSQPNPYTRSELAAVAGRQNARRDQRDCRGAERSHLGGRSLHAWSGGLRRLRAQPCLGIRCRWQGDPELWRRPLRVPARLVGGQRRIRVGHRRPRCQRQRPAGHQVQPGRQDRDAARKGRRRGAGQRYVQRPVRRGHGAQRRYLRGGRPRERRVAHHEVRQDRQDT